MPKAMLITLENLDDVSKISEWNLSEDETLAGYFYIKDVQFPHGFVEHAIVTKETFTATFKYPDTHVNMAAGLFEVDYK